MVFKLIGKLLFKATIPFVIIAGLISYGVYSKGGDPLAMWKGIGSGVTDQFAAMFSKVKDDASNAVEVVADVASVGSVDSTSAKIEGSKSTQLFTWKDANGVTYYSTIAPIDADSKKMLVNPNMNVMAPVLAPKPVKVSRSESEERFDQPLNGLSPSSARNRREKGENQEYSDPAAQDVADQLGGELPGVVGQILSTQGGAGSDAINPAQLLGMLQQ
ncbi:MAG: hypothetical protein ACJAUZ_001525 [Flavobacteriaceae bacterium]|jgi:hypothetical protein